jgi:hypothetical protein
MHKKLIKLAASMVLVLSLMVATASWALTWTTAWMPFRVQRLLRLKRKPLKTLL